MASPLERKLAVEGRDVRIVDQIPAVWAGTVSKLESIGFV
jgi:hypothetical protein